MEKLFVTLQNLEQSLIIKATAGPQEKNRKDHSNVLMNIVGNTAIMGLIFDN